MTDGRTPGECSRDATICLMDKELVIILSHLKRMEDRAAHAREYTHAQNYEKLIGFIKDVQKTAIDAQEERR